MLKSNLTGYINGDFSHAEYEKSRYGIFSCRTIVFIFVLFLLYPLTTTAVSHDIKANGVDGVLDIIPNDGVTITISLDAETEDMGRDWWIIAHINDGFYHYDVATGAWVSGVEVSYQGGSVCFSDVTLLDIPYFPKGTYSFYFGTDARADGTIDETLCYDRVQINCTGDPSMEAAELISPARSISEESPSYVWTSVSNAVRYQLLIQSSTKETVHSQWYQAPVITAGGFCEVKPDISMMPDHYTWKVQAWNSKEQGTWSEEMSFCITLDKLSHAVSLTCPGYAPEFRQLRVVKTDLDTYWIGMATKSNDGSGYPLYLMQTDHLGRVLIPPFSLTELRLRYFHSSDSDYQFALLPLENGGLQVLAVTEKSDDASSFAPDLLKCYRLDADGLIEDERVLDHPYPYDVSEHLDSVYYEDIWAFRTKDQQTIFVAETNDENDLVYGRISDQGEVENAKVLTENWGRYNFVEAAFDQENDKLYLLIYEHSYSAPEISFKLQIYNLDGTVDSTVDISEDIIEAIHGSPYINEEAERPRLLLLDGELLMTLPDTQEETLWLVLFDSDTLSHQSPVEVAGLDFNIRTADCRYALADAGNGEIGLAWTPLHYTEYTHSAIYTRVNLSGKVTKAPIDMTVEDMRNDPRNPRLFLDGSRTTLFYGHYKSDYSTSSEWHLVCRHQGLDFTGGKPDLAVAPPHIIQRPEYASLDNEISYSVEVFNTGEAPSPASTVTLTFNGSSFQADVGPLHPGESQLFDTAFLNVPTPSYLTEMPVVSVDLPDDDWTGNNHAEVPIQFPNLTPVYPDGSSLYTWTVRDKHTQIPLNHAQVSVTLNNIQTAGGETQDVVVIGESDENGEISIRLPDGTYELTLSRYGYPSETTEVTVPILDSYYLELEPPGILDLMFKDASSGEKLHPEPNKVFLSLVHASDDYNYHAKGSEDGLTLAEVMRGIYDYSIKAFGYEETAGQLDITGGVVNPYSISLTPGPRGTITGTVSCGSGCTNCLDGATVALQGTGIKTDTEEDGKFVLEDIPFDSYTITIRKEGYDTAYQDITVDQADKDVGSFCLPEVLLHTDSIATETIMAWNRLDYWPGYLSAPSYEIRTAYGVFDFSGLFSYAKSSDAADFHYIYFDINGRNWYYYAVSSKFSLTDVFCSGLNKIVDGGGDVAGFLIDHVGTTLFENFFEAAIGLGGTGGTTIVRMDRVALYDGDTLLWESSMADRQEYSIDGPMEYVIKDAHADDIHTVTLKAYLKLMNENYSSGPLYLMDTFRFVWHYQNGRFQFDKSESEQNPFDYPTLPYHP